VAAHQKNARRWNAAIAWIDESALLVAPLVRRSRAPRGQPPVLLQKGRHREKVSVAAGLWLSPRRDRLRPFTRTAVNGYFNNRRVAPSLGALADEVGGPLVAVWDGGNMHKGDPIEELLAGRESRLILEQLPAYGSELMPVEQLWTWLKYDRLANFAPRDASHLDGVLRAELAAVEGDQEQLESFFHASRLPLPRALLM
jgi:transposase